MKSTRVLKKAGMLAATAALASSVALAGCSKNEGNGGVGGSAKPSGSEGQPAVPAITVSMYDRGNVPPEAGTIVDNLWTRWVNEESGVKVTYSPVPRWESVVKYNALLAAGDAPDLILEYDADFRNQLYLQKQIIPLDDMIEKSGEYKALMEKFPLLRTLGTKSDGKIYEFGRVLGYIPGTFLFIREDWLEKLNLKAPETTDEAFEVMKAFAKDDPDNNGKPDTYGTNLSGAGWISTAFQDTGWVIEDGVMVKDWERVKAATAYKKRLFDEGLVDKDYLTDKNGEKSLQDFVSGKVGLFAYSGNVVQVYNNYETLKKNVPDAKLAILAFPRSEYGRFSPEFNPPIQMSGVVNVKAKSPEGVMRYVDFMSAESTIHTFKYGLPDVHYKMEDGTEVILDQDKYDKEVSWLGDFRMLGGQYLINEYDKYLTDLDQSKPLDKEVYDMMTKARELYISKERPVPSITHGQYMPGLPNDLQFIANNTNTPISDLLGKAIVSGGGYTTEQALTEAQDLWTKSGGAKLEQWYAQWYQENKDTWVFADDLYSMVF
ncbi:extracellular solute-binding protein [Cohnella cellulosilytica]|uniref:Extracellular solute-binding protein n=1 Tax=Cohnella cellulosilytica TaxID=986710 RepID=A0ABW2F9F8_9BACL